MSFIVSIAPPLGVTPEEFIASWNDRAECRAAADADFAASPKKPDPAYNNAVQLTLTKAAAATPASGLYDLIKGIFNTKFSGRRRVKIVDAVARDGSPIIIVTEDN